MPVQQVMRCADAFMDAGRTSVLPYVWCIEHNLYADESSALWYRQQLKDSVAARFLQQAAATSAAQQQHLHRTCHAAGAPLLWLSTSAYAEHI